MESNPLKQPFKGGNHSLHLIELATKIRIPRVGEGNTLVFVDEVPQRRAACHQLDNAISRYTERHSCDIHSNTRKKLLFSNSNTHL